LYHGAMAFVMSPVVLSRLHDHRLVMPGLVPGIHA
jgi:hypothetical protein